MTQIIDQPLTAATEQVKTIDKVAIVISKGSLEGIYPGLIMANGARMEGIEASVFFTFFGLDAIHRRRQSRIKVATVGNPGMHIPTLIGALPGMSALATQHDAARRWRSSTSRRFLSSSSSSSDSGAGIYACKASVEMFRWTKEDFVEQVDEILTVGEFFELAAGGEIIFT